MLLMNESRGIKKGRDELRLDKIIFKIEQIKNRVYIINVDIIQKAKVCEGEWQEIEKISK